MSYFVPRLTLRYRKEFLGHLAKSAALQLNELVAQFDTVDGYEVERERD